MVLNYFFSTDDVVAAHLIGLTNMQSFAPLNLIAHRDLWNVKNGLLVYKDIEKKYESQDIVRYFVDLISNLLNYKFILSLDLFIQWHVACNYSSSVI